MSANGELYYRGMMSKDANAALMAAYEAAEQKPEVLRIASGGGDVHLGMDIGEWVHENGLSVHVEQGCASSCANYVFTAANRKYLEPGSVLYWHGGAFQEGLQAVGRQKQALQRWREREAVFFKTIGVDRRITTCGQKLQWEQNQHREEPYVGFDYSIDDMDRFGVDAVRVVGDTRSLPSPHPNVLRVHLTEDGQSRSLNGHE